MSSLIFNGWWTDELGEVIKQQAAAQCPQGLNYSTMSETEYAAIAAAVNQGIDSYLEAVTPKVVHRNERLGTRAVMVFPANQVHTLVRRLLNKGDEQSEDLARSFCFCLDIELV